MDCELISSSVHSDQNVNFEEDILLHIMYILSTNILYATYKDKTATMPFADIAKFNFKSWAVNTASIVAVIIFIEFIINPMYGLNHNFLLLPECMHCVHHKLDNIQEPQVLLQCVHSLNIPRFLQSCL